jgi:hypothetical protein
LTGYILSWYKIGNNQPGGQTLGFVKFTGNRNRRGRKTARFWGRGLLGISEACFEDSKTKTKGAVLYFDSEMMRVGIEFTDDESLPGFYKMHYRKNAGGSICGTAFCKHYNITFPSKKYQMIKLKDNFYYFEI